MTLAEALILALALCVDSLVVSAATSLHERMNWRQGLLMALVFGFCQGAFPLLGALIGDVSRTFIEAIDHWIAFALLAFVGGKMIFEQIGGRKSEVLPGPPGAKLRTYFLLGIATSIDAFAVGIGLGIQYPISTALWVAFLIGSTTFLVALLGASMGRRHTSIPERTANWIAGLVLIALGAKILVEHLFL